MSRNYSNRDFYDYENEYSDEQEERLTEKKVYRGSSSGYDHSRDGSGFYVSNVQYINSGRRNR